MRPFLVPVGRPTRATRSASSPRLVHGLVRLLLAAGLLAWQLAVAAPAQAKAGDLDPSFGTGGKVTTDFVGLIDQVFALAVQGNKLVAAGRTVDDFGLARYNPDGTLDPGFGTGGKVTTDFNGFTDHAYALAVQADGKLVAAGGAGTATGDFGLARYNPDGTLDPSFGTGGKVTTDFAGGFDRATALAVQADGKLVAAGFTQGAGVDFALARYDPDGSLDPSFGTGGQVTTDFNGGTDEAFALAVQADGKLVTAGLAVSGAGFDFGLARYNPDGSLDPGFGAGGKVTTDFAGGFDQANALAVQDDKPVVAGRAGFEGNDDFALARYNPDGTLDPSFGTGGKVTTDFPRPSGSFDEARALVVQGRKLVAAGLTGPDCDSSCDFGLVRYRANGALDPSFGARGRVTTDFAGGTDEAFALAAQADGRLVAAGFAVTTSGLLDFALARYRA
jgi:uncharacterized delta-60 repeat protein